MPGSILGTSVRRVEDRDLITGASTYVGNLALPGLLHLAFVRSPMAHGLDHRDRHRRRPPRRRASSPSSRPPTSTCPPTTACSSLNPELPRPPLATDRVRFVGEAVAVVVGETKAAAVDAVELVEVDYDPLPAVADPEAALEDGAPAQFDGRDNLAAGLRSDPAEAAAVLADAEVVVRARMVNQRVAVLSAGGQRHRGAARAAHDGRDDALTIWVSTQMPHGFRNQAAQLFGLDAERVRVIAPHVGGGFGGKAGMLAEHTVAVGVARGARTAGQLGGDPLGEPRLDAARPRPGRLLRARPHPRRARSPGCARGSSATRARTRASAAPSRSAPPTS